MFDPVYNHEMPDTPQKDELENEESEFAESMAIAERVMDENREVLRMLADSDRGIEPPFVRK